VVDPGVVVIEARAPEHATFRLELPIPPDYAVHEVGILPLAPQGEPAPTELPSVDGPKASQRWPRQTGIGLAALGGVGLVAGSVLGLRAISLYHRSQDEGCDASSACPPNALATRSSAVNTGNAATAVLLV